MQISDVQAEEKRHEVLRDEISRIKVKDHETYGRMRKRQDLKNANANADPSANLKYDSDSDSLDYMTRDNAMEVISELDHTGTCMK